MSGLLLVYALLILIVWVGARSMGPMLQFGGFGLLSMTRASVIGPVLLGDLLITIGSMAMVALVEGTIIYARFSTQEELRGRKERLRAITLVLTLRGLRVRR